MQKRILGLTGEHLSIVGFGGIIVAEVEQREANNYVSEAIDAGVNYFDVAPTYSDAEDHLGPALVGKRNGIFLACKTESRSKKGSEELLHRSLKKLKTDHFDLYQLHAVTTLEDVEEIFSPEGAMETYLKAKKEGLIKHIGFSAHSEEAAFALMERYDFDSVLFPINWVNIFNANFSPKVLQLAKSKAMGILALKAMAKTDWAEGAVKKYPKAWYEPIDDEALAKLAYRYTLSQGVTAAIPPGYMKFFRWAVEVAKDFKAITPEEENQLRVLANGIKPLFPQH
ncbi:MAG: aldo/keto reductase [Clostridiaceae bacterium]|nr:aldo/keto reductase [Clostridiaceae bacterium]